ncbi:hypothetical protein BJ138DRAFT_823463 [Hygrophoropsis aurantiaca]|uniref:Uncharacterized protein n=1 Tax=Hygrophoropsis aurantiaca TaxID=72124 RepID=A0ACB8AR68_9AGAM|nr:hypothetical protein BJ138DRAFT_823463 [Hygrophoropsis aurantiaca]
MPATPSLALIDGPTEIGTIASSFLTGCLAIQTYVYYTRFSSDSTTLKIFIAGVCVTEIAHLLCVIAVLWRNTISDPGPFTIFSYTGDMVIALTFIVSFGAQLFFLLRLRKFSGSKLLPLLCLPLSVVFFACGIVINVNAFKIKSVVQFVDAQFVLITLTFVAGAVCDVAITLGMLYHLGRLRKTEFPSTSRVVDTLIFWTIESGLTTSLCNIVAALCFVLMRDNFVWMGAYEVLASVRANALLATLNSRSMVRHKRDTVAGRALELNPRIREQDTRFPTHTPIVVNIPRSSGLTANDEAKVEERIQENPGTYYPSLSV